jgi:hypothetical protein
MHVPAPRSGTISEKTLVRVIHVGLQRGATLTGVIRGPDGRPVNISRDYVTVHLDYAGGGVAQTTLERGVYRFRNIMPGRVRIKVSGARIERNMRLTFEP